MRAPEIATLRRAAEDARFHAAWARIEADRREASELAADAFGDGKSAEGEADAVLIRARADAKSNEIIRLSTTGTVLQYRAIERWDGKLPMMQGGDKLPLLTFDTSKLALNDADREKKLKELLADDKAENQAVSKPAATTFTPAAAPSSTVPVPAPPAPASSN